MRLEELLKSVREENLTKTQLESYRDSLAQLFAELQLEMAELEKEEAMFMNGKSPDQSVADRKIQWKVQPSGQRLIVLKRYATATRTMMTSLRDRLFNYY
jgi:hypothetical protein